MKKNPRPDSEWYTDLDTRSLFIKRGAIKHWMIAPGYGLPTGVYGTGQYGRCCYGIALGIYGADKYGECVYH